MQSVGPKQLGDMYDHLLEQTLEVADLIQKHDDFELLAEPSLSTVLFRALPNNELSANGVLDLDKLNQTLRLEALTRGVAVLGETVVDGKSALKFTILNPCLKTSDFKSLINKIQTLATELAEQQG